MAQHFFDADAFGAAVLEQAPAFCRPGDIPTDEEQRHALEVRGDDPGDGVRRTRAGSHYHRRYAARGAVVIRSGERGGGLVA